MALAPPLRPVLGRWHGDGFVVALPYVGSTHDIVQYSQTLLSIFKTPFQLQGQEVYSTGVYWVGSGPLLWRVPGTCCCSMAEIAMHNAKRSGRHTYKIYDPTANIGGMN